jgi:hypothetical protein
MALNERHTSTTPPLDLEIDLSGISETTRRILVKEGLHLLAERYGIRLDCFDREDRAAINEIRQMVAGQDARTTLDAAMTARGSVASLAEHESLPDSLSTRLAARLLGVDRKTLDKLRREGWLKWRVKNPTSSRKEFLYDKQSVLDLKNSYRVGDAVPHRPPTRRKANSGYVPQHIKLE